MSLDFPSLFARVALPLAALVLSAAPAQAGGVQWSIGIQLPPPPVVVYQTPPPQRIYAPAPVYARQPPAWGPPPQVIYVEPRGHHRHHHRHWRDDDRWERREEWREHGQRGGWRDGR